MQYRLQFTRMTDANGLFNNLITSNGIQVTNEPILMDFVIT